MELYGCNKTIHTRFVLKLHWRLPVVSRFKQFKSNTEIVGLMQKEKHYLLMFAF